MFTFCFYKRRSPLFSTLVIFFTLLFSSSVFGKPTVSNIRFGEHADRTRIVIEVGSEVNFSSFLLANPTRLVVDLPEVIWDLPEGAEKRSYGFIEKYRFGLFKEGVARLVFDLDTTVRLVSKFTLDRDESSNMFRLVLDLEKISKKEFEKNLLIAKKQESLVSRDATKQIDTSKVTEERSGKFFVVIDPGHGGIDPGAISPNKHFEKNVTLIFAKKLKKELKKNKNFDVLLTRSSDVFVGLKRRVEISRTASADLFISLHADSIKNRRHRGISIYTLSEKASDKEAALLAKRENKSDIIAGLDLSQESSEVTDILIDLAKRETMNSAAEVAKFLLDRISPKFKLIKKSHRFAGFAVLKALDTPSVLIELGYLSNKKDEKNLLSRTYQDNFVTILADLIQQFLGDKRS